jgi:hypothetical protein
MGTDTTRLPAQQTCLPDYRQADAGKGVSPQKALGSLQASELAMFTPPSIAT